MESEADSYFKENLSNVTMISADSSPEKAEEMKTTATKVTITVMEGNPKMSEPGGPGVNSYGQYLGIGLTLCSCAVFSLGGIIVKSLSQYHSFSLALWRFICVFIFSLPFLIYNQSRSSSEEKSMWISLWPLSDPGNLKTFIRLILRGLIGCTGTVLLYWSFTYMEVADSMAICFNTPVFVIIVAYFLLGEKCGVIPPITALLTVIGVIIIARPPFLTGAATFDLNLLMGISLSFGAMIASTFVIIILRYLRTLNYAIVTTSFGVIGTIECVILCGIVGVFEVPQNGWDWFLGSSIGILTFVGQLLFTLALKFENSGIISVVQACDVIFTFMWQMIILNVYPDVYSCIGALIVMTGVLIIAFRKWVGELDEKNSMLRKKLWFVLL